MVRWAGNVQMNTKQVHLVHCIFLMLCKPMQYTFQMLLNVSQNYNILNGHLKKWVTDASISKIFLLCISKHTILPQNSWCRFSMVTFLSLLFINQYFQCTKRQSHIIMCDDKKLLTAPFTERKKIRLLLSGLKSALWNSCHDSDQYMSYSQAFYLIYYIHKLCNTTHNYYRHCPVTSKGVRDCQEPNLHRDIESPLQVTPWHSCFSRHSCFVSAPWGLYHTYIFYITPLTLFTPR